MCEVPFALFAGSVALGGGGRSRNRQIRNGAVFDFCDLVLNKQSDDRKPEGSGNLSMTVLRYKSPDKRSLFSAAQVKNRYCVKRSTWL